MESKNKPMPENVKSLLKSRKRKPVPKRMPMRDLNMTIGADPAEQVDNNAVDAIAEAMKVKLSQKRREGRGGWNDPDQCSSDQLAKLLINHVTKGNVVDIANFCAMLYNRDPFGSALRCAGLAFQEEMAKQRDAANDQRKKTEDVLRGAQEETQQLRNDLARAMGYIDRILEQEGAVRPLPIWNRGCDANFTDGMGMAYGEALRAEPSRGPQIRNR